VKKYLEDKEPSVMVHDTTKGGYHTHKNKEIGARQIAEFLSKNGKVVSHNKVARILKIVTNVDEDTPTNGFTYKVINR